ncbi:homing endonuclease [Yersinia phage vB_YenM_P8]
MYTVYQITNKINNKIYIGVHKTDNIDDKYMGTGKLILKAHKKYGIENFQKDILFVFDSINESENENLAFAKEADLVDQEFVNRPDTYNIDLGGRGGRGRSASVRKRISDAQRGKPGKKPSKESRLKMSLAHKGKKLSEEHKIKIGNAGRGKKRPESANEAVRQHLLGVPRKEEHKNNMRIGFLNTPTKICPHCGLECKPAPFKRWHGDNCKARKG